jgi:nucleotide-binding universal stress UspA family protein
MPPREQGWSALGLRMHEIIVVGVDGSPGGYAAVAEAAGLARRFRARLIGLSVEGGLPRYAATMGEVDEFVEEKDRYFAEVASRAARMVGRHGVELEHEVRIGHAADTLVQFVIGTTAQKVNAYSTASVLIVKPRGKIEELWPRGGPAGSE